MAITDLWQTAAGIGFSSAWVLAAGLVGLLVHAPGLRGFDDLPNERSLHVKPVGRLGGLGLFAAAGLALAAQVFFTPGLFQPHLHWAGFVLGMTVLIGLGVGDDRGGLPASLRLLIHLLCSTAMVAVLMHDSGFIGALAGPPIVIAASLTLAVTWMANLYNFMDGSDGMAGLTALTGFGAYAWLAPAGSALSICSAIIAGAALGFLIWNWSPARIFLGDAGSLPLGWAAAILGLIGVSEQAWGISTPVLIFFPFIFDTTVTMSRRAIQKKKFWLPHREHAYQRLILANFTHRHVAYMYAGLMIPGIVTAGVTNLPSPGMLFAIWAVIISIHTGFILWACSHSRPPSPKL